MTRRKPVSEEERNETLQLLALSEAGDAYAQNQLGARLATGYLVKQDIEGALYWYAEAVKLGYAPAKWNAGTMLLLGEGVKIPNTALAALLIEQAAAGGDPSATRYVSDRNGVINGTDNERSQVGDTTVAAEFGESVDLKMFGIRLPKPMIKFE